MTQSSQRGRVGSGREWVQVLSACGLLFFGASALAQNLVSNGNFESGYSTGWNHVAADGGSATYSDETVSPYEGSHALEVVIGTLGANAWSIQSLGPTFPLIVGQEYTLTFWGKAASAGTSVKTVVQNGSYLGSSHSLSTSWAEYSWTFTAVETSPSIRLQYPALGTVWMDDVRVVAVSTNPPASTVSVTLFPSSREQTMVGFGGALSWNANRVYGGSASNANEITQLMFEDVGLDVLRLKNWYYPVSYPSSTDPQNVTEQYAFNAISNLYYAAKAANTNIQVLLTSWSPPASLKSNNNRKNGGTLKSDTNGYMYADFAQYWVDCLDNLGWTPDFLNFQNEPGYTGTWETCSLRPTETGTHAGYAEAADAIWYAIKDRPNCPKMLGSESENIGTKSWADWNGGQPVNTFEAFNTPLLSRTNIAVHGYHLYNMYNPSKIDAINAELNMVRDSFGDRPNWMT